MEKTDRRILRTRQMITESLLNLLMQKKFNDITIQEITDEANVGRATFYLHYRSKEECLIQLLTQGFDSLVAGIDQTVGSQNKDMIAVVEQIFIHTAHHRKLYLALLGDYQSANVLADVQNYIRGKMLLNTSAPPGLDPIFHQAIATYLTGALLTLLMWWLQEEPPLSTHEAARIFVELSGNGIRQFTA